jgi:hypothetical protein
VMGSSPTTAHEHPDNMARRFAIGDVLGTAGQTVLFTLIGAAGMILSAFLEWIRPDRVLGSEISYRAFYRASFSTDAGFLRSAGGIAVAIGLVAIVGLVFRSGWLIRLAGAAGIVGFALFTIMMHRSGMDVPASLGVGVWFMLGGGLVAMFGGFFATRPKVVVGNI